MSKKSVDSARWSWERRLVSGWSNNDGSRHFRVHESMKNGCNVLGANFSSGFLLTGKNNERRRRRAAAALALLAMQQWRDSSTFLMDSAPTPSLLDKTGLCPANYQSIVFRTKPQSLKWALEVFLDFDWRNFEPTGFWPKGFWDWAGIFGTLKFSNIVHATRAGKHFRETILTVFLEAGATEVKFCPAASNLTSFCP